MGFRDGVLVAADESACRVTEFLSGRGVRDDDILKSQATSPGEAVIYVCEGQPERYLIWVELARMKCTPRNLG